LFALRENSSSSQTAIGKIPAARRKPMSNEAVAKHAHLIASRKASNDPHPGTAQLTYYIFEGVLTGFIDNQFIHELALSGGAGGSRDSPANKKHAFIKAAPHTEDVNNPYSYALQEDSKIGRRGGPIPPGSYRILTPSVHSKLGPSARLVVPPGKHQVNNRDPSRYVCLVKLLP
jgi:hypothetical protein